MVFFGINVFAVLTGAVASMAAGFVWYAVLFTQPYLKELGKSPEELAEGPSMLAASSLQFLGCIAIAATLAWLMSRTGMQSVSQGAALAVLVWLGFVAAVVGPMYAYQAFSLKLFGIVSGNMLVILVISGAIIGAWKT